MSEPVPVGAGPGAMVEWPGAAEEAGDMAMEAEVGAGLAPTGGTLMGTPADEHWDMTPRETPGIHS